MPRISINDGSLYYERHGAGFPVFLISGLGGLASFWNEQVAAFSKRYDVITHDSRGVGESDLYPRCGYTVDRMAGEVIALMDRLEIPQAHFVGHSTGGAIAQTLAAEHPKRAASIVLSACWTKPDAYFRRMYGLRKEVLQRLGVSQYVQATTLFLYPSWWIAKNNEKLRHMEEAQEPRQFPAARNRDELDRCDPRVRPNREPREDSRRPDPGRRALRMTSSPRPIFRKSWRGLVRGAEVKIFEARRPLVPARAGARIQPGGRPLP